ncbi:hypothetical protein TELCIR_17826 [Teladorsagia circumcincta]|uniref:Dehydrogenase E1 component domain-containing protein n=1 Tax=Teladorsagia circumcincta TaxID=45464 RepID=A0A2G9TT79_TELCI|nr:hypothetical protein TELCIR_17826 [Teladorsagia circumcincta]
MMQFPVVQMFRKMRGKPEFPDGVRGSGDVLSHFSGIHCRITYWKVHDALHRVFEKLSNFSSDIAKSFECPVIHVNGDHPEDVVKATRLAVAYREKFRKDVFINMVCYRRWGHNELDDPSFTQPVMYRVIEGRDSVPRQYADELIDQGVLTEEEMKKEKDAHTAKLMESFKAIESTPPVSVFVNL